MMATPIKQSAWMDWVAALVGEASRQRYAVTFSPDLFWCLLDDLPLQLIPRTFSRSWKVDTRRPLFLNPHCSLLAAPQLPQELRGQEDLVAGFDLQGLIAWVREPASGAIWPFWLGPRLEDAIRSIRTGGPAPEDVEQGDLAVLAAAGILIPHAYNKVQAKKWSDKVARSSPMFRERGYAPVAEMIHPFHIAALRRYYRSLIRQGKIHLGDGQSARRYVAYNEPVARFFHRQLAAAMSAVAGEPVKPSYVYMASYLSGAVLKKHTDRAQCEFSVTLCVDFSPEPACETSWPIRLQTPRGTTSVYQAMGDGLCYRGTKVPHFRDALAPGRTSTSIFFHYVAEHFTGSLA